MRAVLGCRLAQCDSRDQGQYVGARLTRAKFAQSGDQNSLLQVFLLLQSGSSGGTTVTTPFRPAQRNLRSGHESVLL